jgi:hypothetical protein
MFNAIVESVLVVTIMVTFPATPYGGSVICMLFGSITLKAAATPPTVTLVTLLKLLPVILAE